MSFVLDSSRPIEAAEERGSLRGMSLWFALFGDDAGLDSFQLLGERFLHQSSAKWQYQCFSTQSYPNFTHFYHQGHGLCRKQSTASGSRPTLGTPNRLMVNNAEKATGGLIFARSFSRGETFTKSGSIREW